jgi:hypothetical protein
VRGGVWVGVVSFAAAVASAGGCSSSSAPGNDAVDASAGGDDAGTGGDASTPAPEASLADAPPEATLQGNCEPAKGSACDLVLQNCPAGQQCVAAARSGGGYTTQCAPTTASQHIDKGYPCCPPASVNDNPCLPGLQCVGDPCPDGGVPGNGVGGRCTPYCCANDGTPCGTSPEGYPGHCDLDVVDNAGAPLYDVCAYAPPCKPIGVLPCPSGYSCLVEGDTTGSASCTPIYNGGNPPAQEGASCQYQNSCADGLMCLTRTLADGGMPSQCLMLCYTGHGTPPFDPKSLAMGPGTGGCNAGKTCQTASQIFPQWLGVCL